MPRASNFSLRPVQTFWLVLHNKQTNKQSQQTVLQLFLWCRHLLSTLVNPSPSRFFAISPLPPLPFCFLSSSGGDPRWAGCLHGREPQQVFSYRNKTLENTRAPSHGWPSTPPPRLQQVLGRCKHRAARAAATCAPPHLIQPR